MDRRSEKTRGVTNPIMTTTQTSAPGATRPRFRERQVLRAADLEVEQSYLITARRRHNIGQHGWGIVSGLQLANTPEGLFVLPGMAVDGYGRELIVPASLAIPPDAFHQLGTDALEVWLCYDLVQVNVPQRGSWDCGSGRNSNVREVSRLRLAPTKGGEAS